MSSDEEPNISNIVSEFETQFVPRSDDDEVLWEVQEITAERGKKYKVKWAGTDPATGKAWAQSWVAKHDCTDDLVLEWKMKKQRRKERKKRGVGGRTSTTSRSTKRGGSSTSGKMTRLSTTDVTGSRSTSVQEPRSPLVKRSDSKRKRQPETPVATTSGAGKSEEQSEPPRPAKKQKMNAALEKLVPPLSSDEDEDAPPVPASSTLQQKGPLKRAGDPSDNSDDDITPPPKVKTTMRRSDARSKSSTVNSKTSDVREESKPRGLKAKAKAEVVILPREHEVDAGASSAFQDEELPQKSKKKPSSSRISPPEQSNDLSKEKAPPTLPIKIGPPRGVKRRKALGDSGPSSKAGPSRIKPRKDNSDDERTSAKKPKSRSSNEIPSFGRPSLLQGEVVDNNIVDQPPLRLSIPPASQNLKSRSPDLSPGARARLELFDRILEDVLGLEAAPPTGAPGEPAPDYTHSNFDDNYDIPDTSYPPAPLSPPPSKSKSKRLKPDTPNGLIVPETESSGNSQSQMRSLDMLPPPQPQLVRESPRQSADLPAIAVTAASAESSPASSKDLSLLPRKPVPSINRPTKWPTVRPGPKIPRNAFRSKTKRHAAGAEAPPSSIESFTSPKRVDKGKQKAVEVDLPQSSLSEAEEYRTRSEQQKMTDSGLRKRGQELFDQIQLTREEERLKKKTAKQLKSVNDIVKRTMPPPSSISPLPSTVGIGNTVELHWGDVMDLTGGANSATLDTVEHSEAKSLSEEEIARLRIELRQEEEESTQEAMGIYPPPPPPPPVEEPVLINGGDAEMPPPRSSERSSLAGQSEGVEHVEQPSTDLQLASVMVQPSQEQRHEDMDIDPSPATRPASSPPRPIPENLTDSPKRRLGEALSLLNVKSEEIQRLEHELADERNNLQSLKAELAEAQQSSVPTAPVLAAWDAERAQWTQDRSKWETDAAMWETQRKELSDDKANLLARVTELLEAVARAEQVSVKLSELEAERDAWTKERDALQSEATQRSNELAVLTKTRDENKQERVKWEAEKVSWAEEKAKWETERTTLQEKQEASSRSIDELTASVASLTSAKASAEKDRDFVREQYTQASDFVASVREENMELETRTKIAEGQAREGVAGIKAFYEGRIKTVQAEVGRWKALTELLQEKDRRTNDELRSRAARTPELEDLCGRLIAENKSLAAEVRKLSRAQQRSFTQRNKLYFRVLALKKERRLLKTRLSKLPKTAEGSTQETSHSEPAPPAVEDLDPNDMEILPDPMSQSLDSVDEPALFPCMWRPQWRDQCQHVFDAKEDLERHMQEHFRDLLSE